jgi:glycosyltransferase involved in cell wall biosynthesis
MNGPHFYLLSAQTVYTDHSLLDPDGWPSRMLSRILAFTLSGTSRAICVSQTWCVLPEARHFGMGPAGSTLVQCCRRLCCPPTFLARNSFLRSRDNLLMRTGFCSSRVTVIPNAVDTTLFRPALALRSEMPTVVVISRCVAPESAIFL